MYQTIIIIGNIDRIKVPSVPHVVGMVSQARRQNRDVISQKETPAHESKDENITSILELISMHRVTSFGRYGFLSMIFHMLIQMVTAKIHKNILMDFSTMDI